MVSQARFPSDDSLFSGQNQPSVPNSMDIPATYLSVFIILPVPPRKIKSFPDLRRKNQGRQLSDVCRPLSPCPYVRFSCRSFERLFCVFERKLPDSKVTKLFRSTFLSINSGQKADSVLFCCFGLRHQPEHIQRFGMFSSSGDKVNACGFNGTAPKHIRQLRHIPADTVEGPREQMPQVVGK